jgi:hypothetical protein
MSSTGSGNTGQPGNPPWPPQPGQYNTSSSGNVYATQGGGNININNAPPAQRGLRLDTKVLLVTLLVDAVFFLYGMLSYTGQNTGSDTWRAGIFWFLFLMTCGMLGRWVRRRF